MVDALPGFDLIFEGVDEVLFCEGLVLGEVDLLDQIFLFDHLAGDDSIAFGVDRQVGLREAALAQLLIFD